MAGCAQRSTENGANTAGIQQGELVEWTQFPTFNGSQEGWADFKRVFKEIISASGHSKALELAQLAVKLPPASKAREAWERLDELYGDKELAVLSTMYRHELLELPQGSVHEVI